MNQCLDYYQFVRVAWDDYCQGDLNAMATNLNISLKCSPFTATESLRDWLGQFRTFSATKNSLLDTYSLISSPQWKELTNSIIFQQQPLKKQSSPRVSIITSVFKGDKYIEHFLRDITRQTIFADCELILINPNSPGNEESTILRYLNRHQNIIYKRLEKDPGLYEVWNLGVRLSSGEYLTNANLDDRRAPEHIEEHIKALDNNPKVDLACASLKATNQINETWEDNTAYDTWYLEYPEFFEAADLFQEKHWAEGEEKGKLGSQNIPHCMPVWRKSLHERYGYFDEVNYGSSADWEFWLRCATNGSKFMLLRKPLGLYLVDPNSYQRKFDTVSSFEGKIIKDYFELANKVSTSQVQLHFANKSQAQSPTQYPQKLNLARALGYNYGQHRSGWSYAVNCLKPLHNDGGIFIDSFIEKKFAYGIDPGDKNNNPIPYEEPWIGFVHCPPNVPEWFQYEHAPQSIFATELWKKSFKYCQGLFCLSENMRVWLESQLNIPVVSLIHPTETPEIKFSMEAFLANPQPKIVQIGHWLRKLNSIYYLSTKKYQKVALFKEYAGEAFETEKQKLNLEPDTNSVELVNYLPDDEYDELLSKNIAYVELYDTSANNVVVECIVRNTPLLINPLPGVIDYLGKDYPFYFNSREEAVAKAEDFKLVEQTFAYLAQHPIKEKLTADYFLKSVAESSIYRQLS